MKLEEFSDTFDTLLNSYNVQASFGEGYNKQGAITLDEYEKSVLLTQAQDAIVKSYFDRTLNNQGQGFDDSARRQVDFSSLIKNCAYSYDSTDTETSDTSGKLQHGGGFDDRSFTVTLPSNVLFILNEYFQVTDNTGKRITKKYVVVPISYKEYDREMSKAYGQPLKKQAWRLFSNAGTGYDIKSEIIPIYGSFTDGSDYCIYGIRYVERPTPIILRPLPNGLTIDGYDGSESGDEYDSSIFTGNGIECSLNPILHMDILNKAFEFAITTRGGGTAQRQDDDRRQ